MKRIKTTDGTPIKVSTCDYKFLMQFTWYIDGVGYVRGTLGHKLQITMHRVIAIRAGLDLNLVIDHIDGNKLNNQRENLRSIYHYQNVANRKTKPLAKSGVRGVHRHKEGRYVWYAVLGFQGKTIHLGSFLTKEEAIAARRAAEIKYFGGII